MRILPLISLPWVVSLVSLAVMSSLFPGLRTMSALLLVHFPSPPLGKRWLRLRGRHALAKLLANLLEVRDITIVILGFLLGCRGLIDCLRRLSLWLIITAAAELWQCRITLLSEKRG